ncbi:MAG: ABC-2 family transporter protein [Patescibacteria group bacterium]|nr:ABC-2 family transporter protein [Patescibacteria group bacterium]
MTEVRIGLIYIQKNISSAAELRVSFAMQIIGMMMNNIAFVMVWWLFFKAFGTINGWNIAEAIALQGFVALSFGIVFSFFSGVDEFPKVIHSGALDSVLLTPRVLYARIFTLTTRVSALGDIFFGATLLGIYWILFHHTLSQMIMLGLLVIPASVIMMNFLLVVSCIGFYIPDAVEISKFMFETMFGPSLYPAGLFQGFMRFFFIFVLPTLAIGGIPVEAVRDWNIIKIVAVWLIAVVWAVIGVWMLHRGVKRYESGSLTGVHI